MRFLDVLAPALAEAAETDYAPVRAGRGVVLVVAASAIVAENATSEASAMAPQNRKARNDMNPT